jgi:hypothetical protein
MMQCTTVCLEVRDVLAYCYAVLCSDVGRSDVVRGAAMLGGVLWWHIKVLCGAVRCEVMLVWKGSIYWHAVQLCAVRCSVVQCGTMGYGRIVCGVVEMV